MVKRSRVQSQEKPRRRICSAMRPPWRCFHSHTRSMKASRPRWWRVRPSPASWRSTTFWVAMPAWSVPGTHRAA